MSAHGTAQRLHPHQRVDALNNDHADLSAAAEGRPLRIAIVVDTFARDMGYANNTLCKYLARLGHEVHLVTSDLMPYFQLGSAAATYGQAFAERNKARIGSEVIEGFTVHTVPNVPRLGHTDRKSTRLNSSHG